MSFTPQTALDYLRGAQKRNRLAHAYLISGAEGSGKRTLAAEVTRLVNGASPEAVFLGSAPDVFVAGPESKSRRIVIEQIRSLEHALQMRTNDGRRKVAIISEADRLVAQAANAFLKTLEEPPNNSLLLLLSSNPETLPETILSRCIALRLASPTTAHGSPEQNELIELLNSIDLNDARSVHQAYHLAQRLERLLAKIREIIQEENATALKRDETRYKNTTDGNWLDAREDHYKAVAESQYLAQRAQLVEVLFLWWADVLRANIGVATRGLPAAQRQTSALAARLTTREILHRLRRLEELRDHLGRNVQEALAIEFAFLNIFRF